MPKLNPFNESTVMTTVQPSDPEARIYELLNIGENEEIEFKHAKGGFPKELWPTYSAFANTHGGMIVLGVKEEADGRLSLSRLSREEVEKLKKTFWSSVRSRETISHCLQTNDDVQIVEVQGSFVLTIRVPQALREQRPVYYKRVADEGTYRRNDSGDFLCTAAEVRRMMADADLSRPADSRILKGFTWEDIDLPSFEQYRRLFAAVRPDHPWITEDNDGLMRKLGAYRKDRATGEEGFTLAGLLMFGISEAIKDCAPHFFPDYKEYESNADRWSNRIYPDGTWEANLFQFYRRVLPRLQEVLPMPFHLEDGQRQDHTLAHVALREAFANLCVHADYNEEASLKVDKYPNKIVFSNPGILLITRDQFFRGGESVCRNTSLQQMFMMMGAVEKAGSGVDKILRGWQTLHWKTPYPDERFRPNKVELVMPLELLFDPQVIKELKRGLGNTFDSLDEYDRILLITAFTESVVNHQVLSKKLPLHRADITEKLQKLCQAGVLVAEGHGRGCVYRLNTLRLQANGAKVASSEDERLQANGAKVASSKDERLQANGAKVASSKDERLQAIPKKLSAQKREQLILNYCSEDWRTLQNMTSYLGRNKDYLRNKVLPQLTESGKLEMRFPDTPNHPNQQYKTKKHE